MSPVPSSFFSWQIEQISDLLLIPSVKLEFDIRSLERRLWGPKKCWYTWSKLSLSQKHTYKRDSKNFSSGQIKSYFLLASSAVPKAWNTTEDNQMMLVFFTWLRTCGENVLRRQEYHCPHLGSIKVQTAGYSQDKTWLGQKTSKSVPTCGKRLFGQMKPRLTFTSLMGRETFGKGKEELITCQTQWRQSCLGNVWLIMEPRH